LLANNTVTQANLQKHARDNGINPERLIFADRVDHAIHLGRHQLADLFLDSKTFNAHTTAMESLWDGTPLITIHGTHSASRIAASILKAAKLDELITDNFQDYEALAIQLATDNTYYKEIKRITNTLRKDAELFDSNYYASRLETAYEAAWQQYIEHGEPEDISIKEVRHA